MDTVPATPRKAAVYNNANLKGLKMGSNICKKQV